MTESDTAAEWRPVHGNPNYIVSDDGQVERVTDGINTWAGRSIAPFVSRTGYPSVAFGGKQHTVHRLMMAAFHGPSELLVRHLDDVKTNNTLANLAYGTFTDNATDLARNQGHYYSQRDRCKNGHIYTDETTRPIITGSGRPTRVCKICVRERGRLWRVRHGMVPRVMRTHTKGVVL